MSKLVEIDGAEVGEETESYRVPGTECLENLEAGSLYTIKRGGLNVPASGRLKENLQTKQGRQRRVSCEEQGLQRANPRRTALGLRTKGRVQAPGSPTEQASIPSEFRDKSKWGLQTSNLVLYAGPYAGLCSGQRRAIHALTVRRYVDDIYHLKEYLEVSEGLHAGTPEFECAYQAKREGIEAALAAFDDRTYVAAILLSHGSDRWTALASMRSIWGRRTEVPLAFSIGCSESSIPTHTLLTSFRYPNLPGFDPEAVTEAEVFEVSRLVTADRTVQEELVSSGAMTESVFRTVLAGAFDELIISTARNGQAVTRVSAWIFNVKPRLAAALRMREGLNLIPLYSEGVEPTEGALTNPLDRPYFCRWHDELAKAAPPEVARQGAKAVVRYMASHEIRAWHHCDATLPFLLLNDAGLECAIQKLEARVARRPYELCPELAYA
jgi:hypothetical protein